MESQVFSIRTASKEFFSGQISEWTLRTWVRIGKLRAFRAGSRVLLRREDLESICKPHSAHSAPAREARQ